MTSAYSSIMRPTALLLSFVLTACSDLQGDNTAVQDPSRASLVYAVRGEERPNWAPGWAAVIYDERILLDSPTSAGWYVVEAPVPRNEDGHKVLATETFTLTFEDGACAVASYRAALPDRVQLEWDGGKFYGCGGPHPPAPGTAGTVWELVRLGDHATPASRSPAATLTFAQNGALGGTLACNDGGIRTSWTENGGFVSRGGGFEQTAMGCNQPEAEALGMRFWSSMIDAKRWRREDDRLLITLPDGTEAELRRLL